MPHLNLERLIGTAMIDTQFRATLIGSPIAAAKGFELSDEELDVLASANAQSLEDLAAHVHAWITRAPKPRRSAVPRWTLGEGYQAALAAS